MGLTFHYDGEGERLAVTIFKTQTAEEKFYQMTTEPVEKLIARLSLPTMVSMLVTAFYNLADTFFVRQLHNDSMVAAVGIVLPLMTLIQAVGFYHGHGSGNYISRAYGRQDFKDAEIMACAGFCYAILIGILIMSLGLLFRWSLATLLGARTQATLENTVKYMTFILIAAPFMTGEFVMNNQLRLQGNAMYAMVGLTSGAILNLILDPLLIYQKGDLIFSGRISVPFGFGMGVAGAALASCISQIVGFILLLLAIYRSDNVKIRLKNLTFDLYYVKNIMKGGLPSLARQGMGSVASACLNNAIGLYIPSGTMIDATQAAMTGVGRMIHFLFSALLGFGQGFQPVCGFNYGARKYNRVHDAFFYCIKTGTLVLSGVAFVIFIFAKPIANVVVGTSPEAMRIATFAFRAQLITLPFMAWVVLCNMMLQTMGITGRATVVAIAREGLAFIPVVFLLPLLTQQLGAGTLLGIQLSQSVADILAFLISLPLGLGVLKRLKGNEQMMNHDIL